MATLAKLNASESVGTGDLVAADAKAGPSPNAGDADTKACPDCAETVQAAARICRFCRYEFFPVEARKPQAPASGPGDGIRR